MTPEEAAQAQLDAYNARDIEAFLAAYDPAVEVAQLPSGEVTARGRDAMRPIYQGLFERAPDLHC
ncbi:MAG: nuclear transport factor 2 family protein, partial [Planctomycetota bacterium]|nr:nuclear transport factor 2 family protein [Planctomycetota bacterium]